MRGAVQTSIRDVQELTMVFNSNMSTKLEFRVSVEDRFAQKSIEMYRGFVQLFTDASESCQLQTQSSKPFDCMHSRSRPTPNNQTSVKVFGCAV